MTLMITLPSPSKVHFLQSTGGGSCGYFAVVIHVHTAELEKGVLADCKGCGGGGE